jgi:hypothetical protein
MHEEGDFLFQKQISLSKVKGELLRKCYLSRRCGQRMEQRILPTSKQNLY